MWHALGFAVAGICGGLTGLEQIEDEQLGRKGWWPGPGLKG